MCTCTFYGKLNGEERQLNLSSLSPFRYFLYGGISNHAILSDLYSLDLRTLRWTRIGPVGTSPGTIYGHSMLPNPWYPNRLCVFGGRGKARTPDNEVFVLDTQNRKWSKMRTGGRMPPGSFDTSYMYSTFNDAYIFQMYRKKINTVLYVDNCI